MALTTIVVLAGAVPAAEAQAVVPNFRLIGPDGQMRVVEVAVHRGYHAVATSELARLGWVSVPEAGGWRLSHGRGVLISLTEGSPFFRWGRDLLQLTSEPYGIGPELYVPLQLLTDFFPAYLSTVYFLEEGGRALRVREASHWPATVSEDEAAEIEAEIEAGTEAGTEVENQAEIPAQEARPSVGDRRKVVIIDPGHGGSDPGAIGPSGTQEKDVALGMALALVRALEEFPDLEVHLTRSSDARVPLWQRGEMATRMKGERPGILVSLHANALPSQRSARGFETYFLSEARTEHERRVAANENEPLALEDEGLEGSDTDLSSILKELRNLGHQNWSELLAELIQGEVAAVHPGPNRGVKQGPFAVITNALMPAVLVETGFITNAQEESVLSREDFHAQLAEALAHAVVDFFGRYPPGQTGGGEARPDAR